MWVNKGIGPALKRIKANRNLHSGQNFGDATSEVIQHKDWALQGERERGRQIKKSEKEIRESGKGARKRFINNNQPGSSVQ